MSRVAKSAEFSLSPSRYVLFAQLGLGICAGLLVALLPILLLAKIAGLLLILAVCGHFYVDFRRQKPERLWIADSDAQRWCLSLSADCQDLEEAIELQLEPSQFVTAYLVILYFRDRRGARLIRVIPKDSLMPQEHRILRKLLLARTSCD